MSTYTTETNRLERSYRRAIGQALEYRIKVYHPGGAMKSLGELRDEIDAHEGTLEARHGFTQALAEAFERRSQ